jgi:hypothetical protein
MNRTIEIDRNIFRMRTSGWLSTSPSLIMQDGSHPDNPSSGFKVNQDRIVLLVKPVLDQPVVHTTCLQRDHKLCIMVDKPAVLDTVGDRIPCLAHIILAVQGPFIPLKKSDLGSASAALSCEIPVI